MFFSIFRGHFESFFFKDLVSYTHHTFQDCLIVMEKFLLYQTEHVPIQFADFSRMHIFTSSKFRKSCVQLYLCLQMAYFRRNFRFPKHLTFVETVLKLIRLSWFYLNPLYFKYTYLVLDSTK